MSSRKYFYKGRRDANRRKYNPPQKGKNWKNTSLTGGIIGALVAPHAAAGALLGGAIGSLLGDSDSQTRRKNSNRKAYHAGHRHRKPRHRGGKKIIIIHR